MGNLYTFHSILRALHFSKKIVFSYKKKILLITVQKYLGISATRYAQNLYNKNHTKLLKEIKKDVKKWRELL